MHEKKKPRKVQALKHAARYVHPLLVTPLSSACRNNNTTSHDSNLRVKRADDPASISGTARGQERLDRGHRDEAEVTVDKMRWSL